ncbi:MAG TPA: hypothetical protein VFK27_07000, partial [Bacillales bacterium]|nr:hypothetical protein [Bacillales bacterium]
IAGSSYWLQVMNAHGTPELKVLQSHPASLSGDSVSGLLEKLGLPASKSHSLLVKTFLNEQLPLTRSVIDKGAGWLENAENKRAALEVIKELATRQLPFTRFAFDALLESRGEPLTRTVLHLASLLDRADNNNSLLQSTKRLLPEIFLKLSPSGTEMKENLQSTIQRLGLSYEQSLATLVDRESMPRQTLRSLLLQIIQDSSSTETKRQASDLLQQLSSAHDEKGFAKIQRFLARFTTAHQQQTPVQSGGQPQQPLALKPLLLQILQQSPSADLRQAAQQMLNHVTSGQLNASGSFQTVIHLPFHNGDHASDAMIKWEGKKNKQGQWDADFCRVVFYLDLQFLNETAVDLHIQKRLISIKIYNESHDLTDAVKAFAPLLKEKLETIGYQLTAINQAEGKMPAPAETVDPGGQKGVDFRV